MFLLVCLYALLYNVQLICFSYKIRVIIFKNMLSCTCKAPWVAFKLDLVLYKFIYLFIIYLKAASIIMVPKKPKAVMLNDFRPVALTSVVMKVFWAIGTEIPEVGHQLQHGFTAVCVQGEQMHRWCCCIGPAFCDAALGLSEHIYARIGWSSSLTTVLPSIQSYLNSCMTNFINVLLVSGIFTTAIAGC